MNDFYADYPGVEAEESMFVGADLSRLSKLQNLRIQLQEAQKQLEGIENLPGFFKYNLKDMISELHHEEGDCL